MNKDLYQQLVNLYAGSELSEEGIELLNAEAAKDEALALEMKSLRDSVQLLQNLPSAPFGEETYQRILMKMISRGADIETPAPEPKHIQYHLPMSG